MQFYKLNQDIRNSEFDIETPLKKGNLKLKLKKIISLPLQT